MVGTQPTTFNGASLESVPGIGALTLGGFLREVAARFADREAIVFDVPHGSHGSHGSHVPHDSHDSHDSHGSHDSHDSHDLHDPMRWSYSDLKQQAYRIASGLIAAGVTPGDRVAIVMGNRPEMVASIFGAALAGAVVVPMSTFSSPPELDDLLRRAEPAAVLTQSVLRGRELAAEIRQASALGTTVAVVGEQSWAHLTAHHDDLTVERRGDAVDRRDIGLILFSSGTTSAPKGIVHRHEAPTAQFWLQADVFRRAAESRVWAPLPLFWTAGLTTALGPTLARGGCFVMQETFEAGEALRFIAAERVTEPYTLPHQATAMAAHPRWLATDLSSLRQVFGKSVFTRHPSVQGDPTWTMPLGFGMSETCASVVSHTASTPRDEMRRHTGRILAGTRLRIVDPNTGEVLAPGEIGEIALAGLTVLEHYLGQTRAETLDGDGFLRTGDLGSVDADGSVHWRGRRSEMIKTAGANVAPAELEIALRACPLVRRARVVGIPDPILGEAVTLCVELVADAPPNDQTATELRTFLTERVAKYKVPKHVVFFADATLPATASDAKIRDDELIALCIERLAASHHNRIAET